MTENKQKNTVWYDVQFGNESGLSYSLVTPHGAFHNNDNNNNKKLITIIMTCFITFIVNHYKGKS